MESPDEFFAKRGVTKEQFIKWVLDFGKRRERIESFPIVRQRLNELKRAGADPEMILTGIVLMYPGARIATKRQLQQLRKRLTSLANRLEKLYADVQATVSNPLCHSKFWEITLVEMNLDFTAMEKRWAGTQHYANWFKVFKNYFRAEAKAIADLWRIYEKPRITDGLGPVLRYVKQATGKNHDKCMADILQGAYNALGAEGSFSAEQLKKTRQRYFRELIRAPKPSGLEALYGMLTADSQERDKPD